MNSLISPQFSRTINGLGSHNPSVSNLKESSRALIVLCRNGASVDRVSERTISQLSQASRNLDVMQVSAQDADSELISCIGAETVFIAGAAGDIEILSLCTRLKVAGHQVIVLVDSLEVSGEREALLSALDESGFQLSRVEAAVALMKSANSFVYAYAKAEVAASTVAICAKTDRVLLVQRGCEPFRGFYALPGGFLRPLMETLEECAVRELREETGLAVSPEALSLVTVRSNVGRDTRGHVIDHSYFVAFPHGIDEAALCAADDAAKLCLVPIEEALRMTLAADHGIILAEAIKRHRQGEQWFVRVARRVGDLFSSTIKTAVKLSRV